MRRPLGALQDSISAARQQLSALIGQSERTILLGTVLLASAISAVTGFILTQSAHEWASVLSGEPTNNTLYFWDGLIEYLRFPFLKTILPRHNQPWHDSMAHLRDFIERHTSYPYELIESNVDRLGCGPTSWVKKPATPS